jgi:methylphosphotriester-DNA--protein-cysteine methyltransferase
VPAEDVFGRVARNLLWRVASSTQPDAACREMTAFVTARLNARRRRADDETRLAAMLLRGGSIDAVSHSVGFTPRTLHRRTIAGVGLAPKRLLRIARLYRALSLMLAPGARTLTMAAIDAGYADQAHLCRDAVELLGEPPGRFLARRVRNLQDADPSPE